MVWWVVSFLVGWILCGLIGGRAGYVICVRRGCHSVCEKHILCAYRAMFLAGPIGLLFLLLFAINHLAQLFHRGAMAIITLPTKEQRRAKREERIQVLRTAFEAANDSEWCGNPLVHAAHPFGEMMDEWCKGRPREYPVPKAELLATPVPEAEPLVVPCACVGAHLHERLSEGINALDMLIAQRHTLNSDRNR